jgi:hypothetical protein
MSVYIFNPLEDLRWGAFALRHPMASVFHTVGWVQALQRTYRYEPVVYTTSPPGADLTDGILLCRVCSRLTGRRMVSVPFADHCEPLTSAGTERGELMAALRDATAHTWQYVELRPRTAGAWNHPEFERTASFRLHTLDVRPPLDDLFRRFHRSTMQRKIRRAEREGLVYEEGCSTALLHDFYRLLLLTRRRHRVPPQPIEWFANLIACLPDRAKIAVAKWKGGAIAAMLTILHGPTLVYKYGCSDASLHHLGAVPWLFWKAIADAKARGASSFDLGRSDLDNPGLITFKDRLGATSESLSYTRASIRYRRKQQSRWWAGVPAQILSRLPDRVFISAGRLFYPHAG